MYNFIHKRTSTCITEGKDMVVRNLSTAQNNMRNQHQGGKYHHLYHENGHDKMNNFRINFF